MIKLLYQGVVNYADRFWLHTRIFFAGKPDREWCYEGYAGTAIARVYFKSKLLEFADSSGSIVYRIKYDLAHNTLCLHFGYESISDEEISGDRYDELKQAFRDEAQSSVEKVLLG